MAYIPPTAHITLLATLRRERLLPLAGEVTVEARQHVEAADVVARTFLAERHRLVDVARGLGLPPEKTDAAMLKADGQAVKVGEPIAARKVAFGMLRRAVRSPVEGRLVAAAEGRALLAAMSSPFELRAGIPGFVVTILQSRGVVVETTGALLEGAWGNGREDYATLRLAGNDPTLDLTAGKIEMGMRGAILVAGVLTEAAALKRITEVRIRGLVLGTLAPSLLPLVQKLDIPVLIVEGFGTSGFSAPAFALLSNNAGREAWLHATHRERFLGRRPELIVPLPAPATPPPPVAEGHALEVGKRVRVLRGPEAGQIGTLAGLNERALALPSGLRSRTANVVLQAASGEQAIPVRIPFANLELVE